MTSQEAIIEKIRYYQEKLDRYAANESQDKIVYVLKKLKQLPIRTVHLEQTGIGRTVNALKKLGDEVSEISKSIVMSWKDMVREEEEQNNMESDEPYHEEVEAYRPDEPKLEVDEQALMYDENEQNDDSEPEAEPSREAKSSRHAAYSQEDSDEKHNGFDSESDAEEESHKKVSKSRGKDKTDTDKHSDKRHKRKHESSKSRHESNESTSKRHKLTSSKSEHKEKHGEGQSSKSRDKDSSRHSDKDSKKRHEKDDKHHHKESVKSTDKKSKHDDKKNEHHKTVKKSDEKKAEKRHSSEKHHSSDKHHQSDKNENKHHSQKHTESQEKTSEKETKSKQKDLKRKHEKEPESSPSKKFKKEEFKEPEKPSRKKSDKQEKTSSSTSKSSKSYAPDFSIDSGSGASFAEALGMCSGPSSSGTSKAASSSKKKSFVTVEKNTSQKQMPYQPSSTERHERAKMEEEEEEVEEYVPSALRQPQLEPLAINISSLLPEITPNYKPLGVPIDTLQPTRRISITDEEALSRAMKNKNQRTKVYSGNKTFGKVESLFDLCVRILQDNIDALEYTGGVPFSILKPVLQRATPDQLFNLEHHNPYLIEDTDDLWKKHCEKDFRTKKREEMESWREMYMRCLQEREARLSAITANIKQSQDKSIPVRTTKLAYVDSVVKPPRNIARKQAKNGTASAVTPSERLQQISKSNEAVKVTVPSAGSRVADRPSTSSSQSNKPKKAPLMAKALQSFKNRFRR